MLRIYYDTWVAENVAYVNLNFVVCTHFFLRNFTHQHQFNLHFIYQNSQVYCTLCKQVVLFQNLQPGMKN